MKTFTQFLSEIYRRDLMDAGISKKLKAGVKGDFSSYPFNHIFGDKLRIVIPFEGSGIPLISEEQIRQALKKEGWDVDFNQGVAWKEIKSKKGTSKRQMRLGRLLSRLSKKDDFWKEALHWWELKADPTRKMNSNPGDFSIIISRSPIDILRMSDFPGIHSCHAPPGKQGHTRYYSSAVAEAKNGGAIAYVVRNEDLKKVKNLQAKEIFADPDRGVDGIVPLERLRLRRFTVYNYNGYDELDILIPEERSYGYRHWKFEETIWEWAKKAQKPFIDFNNPPDWDTADLRGGKYQDTYASELWMRFFDKQVYGDKESIDDEAYQISERAIINLVKQHGFTHASIDVDDYGLSARFDFHFPKDWFFKLPKKQMVWCYDDPEEDGEIIDGLMEYLKSNELCDMLGVGSGVVVEIEGNVVVISLLFLGHFEDEGYSLDDVERLLDVLESVDFDYDSLYDSIFKELKKLGYIYFPKKYKHFGVFFDVGVNFESEPMWIGILEGLKFGELREILGLMKYGSAPDNQVVRSLLNILPKHWALTDEAIYFKSNYGFDLFWTYDKVLDSKYKLLLRFKFSLDPNKLEKFNELEKLVKHLDDNWEFYRSRISAWWDMVYKQLLDKQKEVTIEKEKLPKFKPRTPAGQKTFPFYQKYRQQDNQDKEEDKLFSDFREWLLLRIDSRV